MKPEEKKGFEKWLQDSYLPNDLKSVIGTTVEVVGTAAAIVGGVTTIIGIVGFFAMLADFLAFNQQRPNLLQILAEMVQRIETKVGSLIKWNTNANWNVTLGPFSTASNLLRRFIDGTIVSAGARPGLLTDTDRDRLLDQVIKDMLTVRFTVLPPPENDQPAFQQSVFEKQIPLDYAYNGWATSLREHDKEERVDAAALGVSGLPQVPPVEWMGSTPEGGLIWDYRRALPHVIRIVTELVTAFKVYDPAFRTTQRFRDEIQDIIRDLEIFAARWFSCIAWTHKLPLDPDFPDSDYPEVAAPLAYDSRARLFVSHASEHPEVNYWRPAPQEPEFSKRRMEYATKVLAYCGFNDFRSWIDELRKLTDFPTESESVQADSRIVGVRKFRGKSSIQRAGSSMPVKLFHVDWTVTIDLFLQPQKPPYDYARSRAIKYSFFIESYERDGVGGDGPHGLIQRLPLRPLTEHILSIRVFSPEVYVPAEDDGSFGDTSDIVTPGPEFFGFDKQPKSLITEDFLKDASAMFRHRKANPTNKKAANPTLDALGRFASRLSETGLMANERPRKAQMTSGEFATVEFAYLLDFGRDVREGLVTFRAWNLKDERNAGALYLAIEEMPPTDHSRRIRTLLPVYLNPEEIWYPAYSRRKGPNFGPV